MPLCQMGPVQWEPLVQEGRHSPTFGNSTLKGATQPCPWPPLAPPHPDMSGKDGCDLTFTDNGGCQGRYKTLSLFFFSPSPPSLPISGLSKPSSLKQLSQSSADSSPEPRILGEREPTLLPSPVALQTGGSLSKQREDPETSPIHPSEPLATGKAPPDPTEDRRV